MKSYTVEYGVGEIVRDDLTRETVEIVGVKIGHGRCGGTQYGVVVIGYWVNHLHLGGARHPWEISGLTEDL